jgi:tetratricopeptide (TPR) repeat protein
MANVASLKKKAADFEAKKQIDKAIATYREVLDAYDSGEDGDVEIALYNRVGDLLARQGNNPEALVLYERAVDLNTEGGFFNIAIALCNKVLRLSPGRASIYYKLGKISAKKGFKGEAKQNYLEYADRMQKSGQIDEAFRALTEFADLVPDQDDVRLMLADQLTKAGKNAQALEQLQVLHNRYESEGRAAEAQATAERMRAIDPNFEIKADEAKSDGPGRKGADDLIFIDLDAPPKRPTRATTAKPVVVPPEPPRAPTPAPAPPPPAPEPEPVAPEPEPLNVGGLELISAAVEGSSDSPATEAGGMLGLEPTSFSSEPEMVAEPEPMAPQEFAEIDLTSIEEVEVERPAGGSDLALGGDLPMIDVSSGRASGALEIDVETVADSGLIEIDTGAALDLDVEPTAVEPEPATPDLPIIDVDADAHRPAEVESVLEEVTIDTPTSFDTVDADLVDEPPPPVRRSSSMLAANSVMTLRIKVEDEPENWSLRRQLAEALLEGGERDEGMKELEAALAGFDKANDIDSASSIADEIVRINPASVRYHQKRVEYAFRSNDKPRTAEAYLSLADALLRDGQAERSRAVYQRVLEISPNDIRAQAALETFMPAPAPAVEAPPPGRATTVTKGRRYTGAVEAVRNSGEQPAKKAEDDGDFVSLGDWLREDEGPKSTRMVVDEQEPTGDEQADFADMLKKFKQGVAENVEEEDHESHYDLGVAFKEMGLIDEAIAEFQKALRGTQHKARTYEALGQCFLEKKQLPVATTILQRALNEPGIGDEQLVGVLYLLGYISEALGKLAEAKGYYERVFGVDIQFRDVGDRLNAVDKAIK